MTWDEFKANYPHLGETLEILANDNGYRIKETIDIPPFIQPVLNIYEDQASQLDSDEKETLALGDDDARDELLKRTGFVEFDDFLTEAFEGILSDNFWQMPS
jgi:hypothetical protein